MALTYDISTDLGKVRLLIGDTVDSGHIFEDAEIQAMLDLEDDSIRLAAADLLDVLGGNYVRAAQAIKVLDIEIKTDSVSYFSGRAKALRAAEEDSGAFEIAEMVSDPFAARERIYKDLQRSGGL